MRKLLDRKTKKGLLVFEDVLYSLVFMFAAALLIFMLYYVYGQIKTPVSSALTQAVPAGETAFNVTSFGNQIQGGVGMFNNIFPLLIIGLIIMTCISALFMESHPAFFFVSLILLGIVMLVMVVFSNIYQQITEDAAFGDTDSTLNILGIFMKFLPLIALVLIVVVMIIIFGRGGGQGGL